MIIYGELETLREFAYLGDRLRAGGGCVVAMTGGIDVGG